MIQKPLHRVTADIKGGQGRQDDRAGIGEASQVLEVDDRKRGLAKTQHQRPVLLERYRPDAVNQSSCRAGGQGSESAGAAGYDGCARESIRARGDGGVELAVAVHRNALAGLLCEPGRVDEIFGAGLVPAQLVPQDLAGAGRDHEVNPFYIGVPNQAAEQCPRKAHS